MTNTAKYLNRKGTVDADGFIVNVDVIDVRQAFGRTDLLIEANGAKGQKWVSKEKVTLEEGS